MEKQMVDVAELVLDFIHLRGPADAETVAMHLGDVPLGDMLDRLKLA